MIEQEQKSKYSDEINKARVNMFFEGKKDTDILDRAELYSEFLKDGDFEEWQPKTELNLFSNDKEEVIEFIESRLKACRIFLRALWIMNRFTPYLSAEWGYYAWFCNSTTNMINTYKQMLSNLNRKPNVEDIQTW